MTSSLLADVVELDLLFVEETLSRSELLDWLEEEGSSEDTRIFDQTWEEGGDEVADASAAREARLERIEGSDNDSLVTDEVVLELAERAEIVGESYPLVIEGSLIRRGPGTWQEAPVYSFLAALNARFLYSLSADFHEAARIFERVIVPAIRNYWQGDAEHFGWPREFADTTRFPDAVKHLSGRMREKLAVDLRQIDPGRYKDFGLDAVAWYPLDSRIGKAILLVQCAIGEGWDTKGIFVEAWSHLIRFAVTPVRGLAFPFVPTSLHDFSDEEWRLLCGMGGIWFDRLRIARLAQSNDLDPAVLQRAINWTEGVRAELVG